MLRLSSQYEKRIFTCLLAEVVRGNAFNLSGRKFSLSQGVQGAKPGIFSACFG